MDGTALTMQRAVDQSASSLEQYQRIYETLPKDKQEALDKYFNDSLEQRQQSKEKLAEIATTAVITAAALAAAPFTAGASVALVASLAFAAGAATKTIMTAAIEGNDFQWTPENIAKNVVLGGVSAALNFVGGGEAVGALEGIGGKVAGDVVKDVATTSLRDGGEKALQEGVTQLIAKGGKDISETEVRALAERVAASGATAEEKAAVAQSIEKAVAAHSSEITDLSAKVEQSTLAVLRKQVVSSSFIGGASNAASEVAAAPFSPNGLDVKELVTSTLTGMAVGAVMPLGLHAFQGVRQLTAGVSRETTTVDGVIKDVAVVHPPKAGEPDFVIQRGDTEIAMGPGSKPVELQEGDRFKLKDDTTPAPRPEAAPPVKVADGDVTPAPAPEKTVPAADHKGVVEARSPEQPNPADDVHPGEAVHPGEVVHPELAKPVPPTQELDQAAVKQLWDQQASADGVFKFQKGYYEANLAQVDATANPNGIIFSSSEKAIKVSQDVTLPGGQVLKAGTELPNGVQLSPGHIEVGADGSKTLTGVKLTTPPEGVRMPDGSTLKSSEVPSMKIEGGAEAKPNEYIIQRASTDDAGHPRIDTYAQSPETMGKKWVPVPGKPGVYAPNIGNAGPVEMVKIPDDMRVKFMASYGEDVSNTGPAYLVKSGNGNYIITERDLRETYIGADGGGDARMNQMLKDASDKAGADVPRAGRPESPTPEKPAEPPALERPVEVAPVAKPVPPTQELDQAAVKQLWDQQASADGVFKFQKGYYEANLAQVDATANPNGIIFSSSEKAIKVSQDVTLPGGQVLKAGTELPNGVQLSPGHIEVGADGSKTLTGVKLTTPPEGVRMPDGSTLKSSEVPSMKIEGGAEAKPNEYIIQRASTDDAGHPRIDTYAQSPETKGKKWVPVPGKPGVYAPNIGNAGPVEMVKIPDDMRVKFMASYGEDVSNTGPAYLVKSGNGNYIITERDLRETYIGADGGGDARMNQMLKDASDKAGVDVPRAGRPESPTPEKPAEPPALEPAPVVAKPLNGPGYPDRLEVTPGSKWYDVDSSYAPPSYTAKAVLANDRTVNPEGWADPADPALSINAKMRNYNSFEKVVKFGADGKPLNPMGPTGLADRGLLGNWGPNHAADPIVTRVGPDGKLQALLVVRKDTIRDGSAGLFALPGGIVNAGEMTTATLKRELGEETTATLNFDRATPIYQGYVKDPRNTDNAWMETDARHLHLADGSKIIPKGQDDAAWAEWRTLDEKTVSSLYGDHEKLVRQAISTWEQDTGRIVEGDGTVLGGRVNAAGERINARGEQVNAKDQVLDSQGHPVNDSGQRIDSRDLPISKEFPNYSEEQKVLGRQKVESELADWKTIDGKPVKQEFDSLTDKLGMTQAEKDEILSGLAAVRDHGAKMQGIDSEQVVNWNHTEREFGAAVQYADRNGFTKEQTQDLLLAAMWSDGSKSKFNFTTHNLDGALAFEQYAKNNLKDFSPERVAQIQQAIREHQVAPPEFMSMIYGGAIMGGKPPLTEDQMKTLGGLRAKMANPFKPETELMDVPGGPPGAKALKLSPEEQALLRRSGQDYWYVPSPENSWNKVSRGLIDADGIDNYAGPGGLSKIIKLRGPDKAPVFRDRSARFVNPEDPSEISSQESWMRSQRDFLGSPEKGNFGTATAETRAYVNEVSRDTEQHVQAAQKRIDDWINSVDGRKELNLPSPTEQPEVKIPGWTGTPEHPDLLNPGHVGNTPEELSRARKIWDRYGDELGREQRVDLQPMDTSYEPVMKPEKPSPEYKFSGVYDGPTDPRDAIRVNKALAKQQKDFNDSIDSIVSGKPVEERMGVAVPDSAKAPDTAEVLEKLRGIAFSEQASELPSTSLMKLYTTFRDKSDYEDMIRLYNSSPNEEFKKFPIVKEYLAVAYNKTGSPGKALDIVQGIEKDATNAANPHPELMNGEVYGAEAKAHVIRQEKTEKLLSAVQGGDEAKITAARAEYAKAYDLADNAPIPTVDALKAQAHEEFTASSDAYTKGFHVNYEYYPGINATWSNLALGDLDNARNLAELTHYAAIREGGLERGNYWTSMTMLESGLVSGLSNKEIDATVSRIIGGNDIPKGQLNSTFDAWTTRVKPALEKMQSNPELADQAKSMLERFKYAEAKLKDAIANPSASAKASGDGLGDTLIERSHNYRGQSVYDAEIVKNNFGFGGIISDTSITRADREEFSKLLNGTTVKDLMTSLGGDPSTLPSFIGDHTRLSDIQDPEEFIATAQKIVRQNFGNDAKKLEIIDGLDHKALYDKPIESLNEASGIPPSRDGRVGFDSRTSLSAEFAKGLGDCRHHAQAMQLLYDMWQGGKLNDFLRQAETAASPAERAQALARFGDLERTQLRTLDVTVNAPIEVKAAYQPIRPNSATNLPADRSFIADDKVNYIEDHTMNILVKRDAEGHFASGRFADSFYNDTYKWSNGAIDNIATKPDGKGIQFSGGVLNGVQGADNFQTPVTLELAVYSGDRTKIAANDPGLIFERGLPVANFEMMNAIKNRPQITSQLTAITDYLHDDEVH